ncbi:unnamed protein product [Nyctereutes procyonoides]|uniref:(raccoon dog) hypothetical protein n=1 Tax=Nyctereutes procyonoides TaxID=34880 RepID=A0A811XWI7_NYCPR|nr:unnamed protein product [Nyctereutes procyonoides]
MKTRPLIFCGLLGKRLSRKPPCPCGRGRSRGPRRLRSAGRAARGKLRVPRLRDPDDPGGSGKKGGRRAALPALPEASGGGPAAWAGPPRPPPPPCDLRGAGGRAGGAAAHADRETPAPTPAPRRAGRCPPRPAGSRPQARPGTQETPPACVPSAVRCPSPAVCWRRPPGAHRLQVKGQHRPDAFQGHQQS